MFVLGQTRFNQLAAQPAKPGPLIGYELVDTSGVFPLLQFVIFERSALCNLKCLTFVQSLIHLSSASLSKLSSEFQLQEVLLHCSKFNLDLFKMSGEPASQSLWTVRSCMCLQSFARTLSRACPNWAYSPVHMTQSVLDLFARVCARVCKVLRSLWQASQY